MPIISRKKNNRNKSKLEKKYESFFKFENSDSCSSIVKPHTVTHIKQIETWVTYGAFEDPIY